MLLCALTVSDIHAQSDPGALYGPIGTSPTSAGLSQYGDVPVSPHTGTANVGIPLLAGQADHVSVPVALGYQTSGIKVNQLSSWVGLGWNLSAGGVITRQINDQPDDAWRMTFDRPYCVSSVNCLNCIDCNNPQTALDTLYCEQCTADGADAVYLDHEDRPDIGYLYHGARVASLFDNFDEQTFFTAFDDREFLFGNYTNTVDYFLVGDACGDPENIPVITEYEADALIAQYQQDGYAISEYIVGQGTTQTWSYFINIVSGIFLDPMSFAFGILSFVGDFFENIFNGTPDCTFYLVTDPIEEVHDTEPDVFSFNVNGTAGQFVFDANGLPQLLNDADLKIEYTLDSNHVIQPEGAFGLPFNSTFKGAITDFTITTPDGIKYVFRDKEVSVSSDRGQQFKSYTAGEIYECDPPLHRPYYVDYTDVRAAYSSWYLSEIIFPAGREEVRFSYDHELIIDHSQLSQTFVRNCDWQIGVNWEYETDYNSLVQTVFGKRLSLIEFKLDGVYGDEGALAFVAEDARDDVFYPAELSANMGDYDVARTLDFIRLRDRNGQTITEVDFDYGRFPKLGLSSCSTPPAYMTAHQERIRLDQITIRGWNENGTMTEDPPFVFAYNDLELPPRHSPKQDFWGYYNGISESLIPEVYAYANESASLYQAALDKFQTIYSVYKRQVFNPSLDEALIDLPNFVNNDRNVHPKFSQGGILRAVTYPMGSRTNFTYENHEFLDWTGLLADPALNKLAGGLRIQKIETSEGLIRTYVYNDVGGPSYGRLLDLPQFAQSKSEQFCTDANGNGYLAVDEKTIVQSNPLIGNGLGSMQTVGYWKVKEQVSGNGHIEYNYDMPIYYGVESADCAAGDCQYELPKIQQYSNFFFPDNYPFAPNPNYGWKNGLPTNQKTYNEAGDLQLEQQYTYGQYGFEKIVALKTRVLGGVQNPMAPALAKYFFTSGDVRLDTLRTIYHTDEGSIASITSFDYQNPHIKQPTQTRTAYDGASGLIEKTTTIRYAHDLNDALLLAHDMTTIPLETEINNKAGGGSKVEFFQHNGMILPKNQYIARDDGTWKLVNEIVAYDTHGYVERMRRNGQDPQIELDWERGLLTERRVNARTWTLDYFDTRTLDTSTDPNAIMESYSYDGLGRATLVQANNNQVTNAIQYNFQGNAGNQISTTLSFPGDPYQLPDITGDQYLDLLGRSTKNILQRFTFQDNDYQTSSSFDAYGRLVLSCDPNSGHCSEARYEASPLNRIEHIVPAGGSKAITVSYGSNKADDVSGYPANTLFKTVITDENGHISWRFTDLFGRLIAQGRLLSGEPILTTYTYNDRDQVTFAFPPGNSASYSYTYRSDGLLDTKSIPDNGTYTYTYNALDQLEYTTMPGVSESLHFEYNTTYPDYLDAVYLGTNKIKEFLPYQSSYVSGWVGTERTKVFLEDGTEAWLESVYGYDNIGRITSVQKDYVDGQSVESYAYDQAGNLRSRTRQHTGPDGVARSITYSFDYDKGVRLKQSSISIGGQNQVLSDLEYDDRDWLIKRTLGAGLEEVTYGYHSRGWLARINSVDATFASSEPCVIDPPCEGPDCDPRPPTCEDPTTSQTLTIDYDCEKIRYRQPTEVAVELTTRTYDGEALNDVRRTAFRVPLFGFTGRETNFPDRQFLSVADDVNADEAARGVADFLQDCAGGNPSTQLEHDILAFEEDVQIALMELPPIVGGPKKLFGMDIFYDSGNADLLADAQYNGNVSWMRWRAQGEDVHRYGFAYDDLDRMTRAKYDAFEDQCIPTGADAFTVEIPSMDDRGNITALARNGFLGEDGNGDPIFGRIDDLNYAYTGSNLLQSVTDGADANYGFKASASTYTYDAAGNLTGDSGRNIVGVDYNFLHLPKEVPLGDGSFVKYVYDADGTVYKQIVYDANTGTTQTRHYQGGVEYVNGQIESIYHEEGRYVYGEGFDERPAEYHEYVILDHLGNLRVRFADLDGDGAITVSQSQPDQDELLGTYHYYPFGMRMEGVGEDPSLIDDNYQYNGIEHVALLGLNFSAYRVHDPATARWWQTDPYAEAFGGWSPYNTMLNNPATYADPTGGFPFANAFFGAAVGAVAGAVVSAVTGSDFGASVGVGAGIGFGVGGGVFRQLSSAILPYTSFGKQIGRSNLEWVIDQNGNAVLVGNAGGNEFDIIQHGTVHTDGSVTVNPWVTIVVPVGKKANFNAAFGTSIREPGAVVEGFRGDAIQTLDGLDDPILNLITLGQASTASRGIQGIENLSLSAFKGTGDDAVKGGKSILNAVNTGKRTGSAALKSVDANDVQHFFPNIVDNYASFAEKFALRGGDGIIRDFYQISGSLRGRPGIFEWIVEGGKVTHRRFIPRGVVNGIPNQIVK